MKLWRNKDESEKLMNLQITMSLHIPEENYKAHKTISQKRI